MLGFTLSKMNLLIFCTAIFVIVYFFTGHLDDSLKVRELNDMLNGHVIIASEMLSSPSFCDSLKRSIPPRLDLGNFSSFYYVLKVSAVKEDPNSPLTTVIFSAAERKNPDRVLAASSFNTTAKVVLLPSVGQEFRRCDGSDIGDTTGFCEQSELTNQQFIMDPQESITGSLRNRFFFVKQYEGEELHLYILTCGSVPNFDLCADAKFRAGMRVLPATTLTAGGFRC